MTETETIQQKLARRSQPSYARVRGVVYRVVSSQTSGDRIARLGIDPGIPGASIKWIDAASVTDEPEAVAKAAYEAQG